ncbi:ArnT family glycosyltransferase [Selenomonas bovis]|uniref:ArnT family glycosyltransferase n=1 Tax=Selenomonas bovis TaxID=416586 RepID=UPI0009073229|nr:glycosyltransferase family 39 protein [Selenomonas bovis]
MAAGEGGARRHLALLLLFALLVYFVGNGALTITDPVESNYVETAKEMMASGDLFSPRIYGRYWYDKPVLFYWELIAAFSLFGQTEFAARFFPAVLSAVSLLLTYWFGRRLYGERVGFVAALLMGTSVELWYVGHAVITDMTLFASMSGMLISFYLGYEERRVRWYYLAFFLAGVAVLTKGPIGLCLPGLIILLFLAWERRLRELWSIHILAGFALFFAVAAIWYYPMVRLHGSDFLDTFLGVHNVLRATVSEHPRDNVWYFYVLVYLLGLFPWSFASLPAAVRRVWRRDLSLSRTPAMRFLVVWAVTVFAVFECFATKYVTYTLPYLLPLSLLLARYFAPRRELFRLLAGGMTALFVVLACFVAPPLMEEASGREAAALLAETEQRIAAEAGERPLLVSYGRYSCSLVYYSGLVPYCLRPRSVVLREQPGRGEISWNEKNVMPFLAEEDLPTQRDVLLLTDVEKKGGSAVTEETLHEALSGSWERLAATENGRQLFLRRAERETSSKEMEQ